MSDTESAAPALMHLRIASGVVDNGPDQAVVACGERWRNKPITTRKLGDVDCPKCLDWADEFPETL